MPGLPIEAHALTRAFGRIAKALQRIEQACPGIPAFAAILIVGIEDALGEIGVASLGAALCGWRAVATAEAWRAKRRPEILRLFAEQITATRRFVFPRRRSK